VINDAFRFPVKNLIEKDAKRNHSHTMNSLVTPVKKRVINVPAAPYKKPQCSRNLEQKANISAMNATLKAKLAAANAAWMAEIAANNAVHRMAEISLTM
jgi:hypothetical protein